ncbi:MAG: hypothetical protein IJ133_04825, partial [Clostridia bacterium]|nr:hypothetical protein [Clostridia bacterium]
PGIFAPFSGFCRTSGFSRKRSSSLDQIAFFHSFDKGFGGVPAPGTASSRHLLDHSSRFPCLDQGSFVVSSCFPKSVQIVSTFFRFLLPATKYLDLTPIFPDFAKFRAKKDPGSSFPGVGCAIR